MKQILHSYKLRLTNLSQGNRAIKLNRLSKRRDIDLRQLGFLEKLAPEQILEKIIAGKDVRLINRLNPRLEATNLADRRLNQIYRSVRTIFEESGTYDLFLGYPFVEGRFIDGTIARCPVLLFPVRLYRNLQIRPRWSLEIIRDEPVQFNKTFFRAYELYQQVRLKSEFWEEEFEAHADWGQWVQHLYERCKHYELDVNFNSRLFNGSLDSFKDFRAEDFERFRTGQLMFQPQAVLGIFPQSDSALLNDYNLIEQAPEAMGAAELFGQKILSKPPKKAHYIKEESRYFLTEVDQSQEEALLRIKQGQSLVIHGPPGTGKSQVIVNIIADAMAHGKKVLLVSQKRAALDVVYKRLSALGLGRFAMLVHDYRHDRSAIYQKIKKQIEDIPNFQRENNDLNLTQWEHEYKLLSRQSDQLSREFDALFQALSQHGPSGLSVHQLYLRSNPKSDRLKLGPIVQQIDHSQLENFLQKLRAIFDYRDFLHPEYPWYKRLPFHHHQYEQQLEIREMLEALALQIEDLHNTYQSLSKRLSTKILDPKLNDERISLYREIDQQVQQHLTREGCEAIHQCEWKPNQIEERLDRLETVLKILDQRKYLDDALWQHFKNLDRHTKVYKEQQHSIGRFLSIPYQRARWFFRHILKEKDIRLDPISFKQIWKEVRGYRRLHNLYVRYYEKPFFDDFSLYDSQAEKWEWLDQKRRHLAVYNQIQSVKVFPKIKPGFVKGKFNLKKWQQSLVEIDALKSFSQSLKEQRRNWGRFLHKDQVEKLSAGIRKSKQAQAYIQQLKESFSTDFQDLKALDAIISGLGVQQKELFLELKPIIQEQENEEVLIQKIQNSVYCYWIEQVEKRHPILAEVSSRSWPRKQKDYIQKLAMRRQKVVELIDRRIKEQIVKIIEYNRLNNPITYRPLLHQVSKKRRVWSIRKLVQELWNQGLREVAPCWMASPESVAAIFPMEQDFFDVVVFDEASQCFVERAIPVILRAKQSVIAGDPKQLRPLDLYKVSYEDTEAEFVENEIALEVESILDLAQNTYPEVQLNWHYRSQEEELINFSNHAFYEGKLQVLPPAHHPEVNWPPLEWVAVKGLWKNNRNIPEAEKVVALVQKLLLRPDKPSLGIVTFNYHQQELIKDLIDQTLERLVIEDPPAYERLFQALHLTVEEDFQGLFVKNIENVQGDERDIIIFSVGYAYNEKGKLNTHFGLLNQQGGENRLNVAITRARKKIYVLCSFLPGDLKVDTSRHEGPRYFRDYLSYVKAVSESRQVDALHLLNQQNEADLKFQVENQIADYLESKIRAAGFFVLRNFGDTAFRLDLAIKNKEADKDFILGIECEGSHYFSGKSPKEREIYRPALLSQKGWKIYRVWARNFWLDREKEWTKILNLLKQES